MQPAKTLEDTVLDAAGVLQYLGGGSMLFPTARVNAEPAIAFISSTVVPPSARGRILLLPSRADRSGQDDRLQAEGSNDLP